MNLPKNEQREPPNDLFANGKNVKIEEPDDYEIESNEEDDEEEEENGEDDNEIDDDYEEFDVSEFLATASKSPTDEGKASIFRLFPESIQNDHPYCLREAGNEKQNCANFANFEDFEKSVPLMGNEIKVEEKRTQMAECVKCGRVIDLLGDDGNAMKRIEWTEASRIEKIIERGIRGVHIERIREKMRARQHFFVCKRHIVDGAKEMQEKKVKKFECCICGDALNSTQKREVLSKKMGKRLDELIGSNSGIVKAIKAFRDRDDTQGRLVKVQICKHHVTPEMREILREERCLEVTPLARRLGFRQKTFHDLETIACFICHHRNFVSTERRLMRNVLQTWEVSMIDRYLRLDNELMSRKRKGTKNISICEQHIPKNLAKFIEAERLKQDAKLEEHFLTRELLADIHYKDDPKPLVNGERRRGRGRPRKNPGVEVKIKGKVGRPRKNLDANVAPKSIDNDVQPEANDETSLPRLSNLIDGIMPKASSEIALRRSGRKRKMRRFEGHVDGAEVDDEEKKIDEVGKSPKMRGIEGKEENAEGEGKIDRQLIKKIKEEPVESAEELEKSQFESNPEDRIAQNVLRLVGSSSTREADDRKERDCEPSTSAVDETETRGPGRRPIGPQSMYVKCVKCEYQAKRDCHWKMATLTRITPETAADIERILLADSDDAKRIKGLHKMINKGSDEAWTCTRHLDDGNQRLKETNKKVHKCLLCDEQISPDEGELIATRFEAKSIDEFLGNKDGIVEKRFVANLRLVEGYKLVHMAQTFVCKTHLRPKVEQRWRSVKDTAFELSNTCTLCGHNNGDSFVGRKTMKFVSDLGEIGLFDDLFKTGGTIGDFKFENKLHSISFCVDHITPPVLEQYNLWRDAKAMIRETEEKLRENRMAQMRRRTAGRMLDFDHFARSPSPISDLLDVAVPKRGRPPRQRQEKAKQMRKMIEKAEKAMGGGEEGKNGEEERSGEPPSQRNRIGWPRLTISSTSPIGKKSQAMPLLRDESREVFFRSIPSTSAFTDETTMELFRKNPSACLICGHSNPLKSTIRNSNAEEAEKDLKRKKTIVSYNEALIADKLMPEANGLFTKIKMSGNAPCFCVDHVNLEIWNLEQAKRSMIEKRHENRRHLISQNELDKARMRRQILYTRGGKFTRLSYQRLPQRLPQQAPSTSNRSIPRLIQSPLSPNRGLLGNSSKFLGNSVSIKQEIFDD
ncbi:unnamed protein product, partial [Mesorhabditis belari]|uniref:Uncharacterized protein n=1 Tax=Mesorhabditis belari TaxID=2138241 RepID=A0AAF3EI76_9BILA